MFTIERDKTDEVLEDMFGYAEEPEWRLMYVRPYHSSYDKNRSRPAELDIEISVSTAAYLSTCLEHDKWLNIHLNSWWKDDLLEHPYDTDDTRIERYREYLRVERVPYYMSADDPEYAEEIEWMGSFGYSGHTGMEESLLDRDFSYYYLSEEQNGNPAFVIIHVEYNRPVVFGITDNAGLFGDWGRGMAWVQCSRNEEPIAKEQLALAPDFEDMRRREAHRWFNDDGYHFYLDNSWPLQSLRDGYTVVESEDSEEDYVENEFGHMVPSEWEEGTIICDWNGEHVFCPHCGAPLEVRVTV